ncbi:hypothetical protein N7448_000002 [Penicillium atrosanguineum]|nr:hypothetical protein N7526_006342 [Penicillium atrosanguineum]KAJ5148424.1 hypothetical protein N7448_000002 [Penicillium atrosanguineum]
MASLSPGSSSSYQEGAALDDSQEEELNQGQPHLVSRNMSSPGDWQSNPITQQPETAFEQLESQIAFYDSPPTYREKNYDLTKLRGKFSTDFVTPPNRGSGHKHSTAPEPNRKKQFNSQRGLCLASENTAHDYSRSAMTQNLIRIYHDSMENALSCWLTEHNCPYSNSASDMMPHSERKEWGPSWSNRMCIRVCRLDRASSSARGRALSAEEDKTAARALHLAIMAFASQWTQHARKGTALSVPEHFDLDERSIRQNVWNKARHALEHSAKIPSFRIIFANIIFSLTQCPLDDAEDNSLGQLLENDIAPMFLEIANRQLFTFRHKFTILQREGPQWIREHRRGSMRSTTTEMLEVPEHSEPPHFDPILACYEYRSTLSLLSWLGIMFDTLSSAMYQRPLVVSDEDSQIASAPTSNFHSNYQVDLDGWNIPRDESRNQADVWGDFFLRRPIKPHGLSEDQPRWPCSYERAAAVLSEATPVKVLLYRRLTQLQTLIYREASSGCFEEIIQKTIQVYRYWNCTYQKFMLDCVANHNLLPPRIQSCRRDRKHRSWKTRI